MDLLIFFTSKAYTCGRHVEIPLTYPLVHNRKEKYFFYTGTKYAIRGNKIKMSKRERETQMRFLKVYVFFKLLLYSLTHDDNIPMIFFGNYENTESCAWKHLITEKKRWKDILQQKRRSRRSSKNKTLSVPITILSCSTKNEITTGMLCSYMFKSVTLF